MDLLLAILKQNNALYCILFFYANPITSPNLAMDGTVHEFSKLHRTVG